MPATASPPEPLLARLGRAAARRRGRVVLTWVILLVGAIVGGPAIAGKWSVDYTTPGSDSRAVARITNHAFPASKLDSLVVVWKAPAGVTSPEARRHLQQVLANADRIPGVPLGSLKAARISPDGRYGLLSVPLEKSAEQVAVEQRVALLAAAKQASGDGVTVHFGGQVMSEAQRGSVSSEGVGLAIALVILLLTFSTIVAAGLPLATALFGIGTSGALVGLLANVVKTPDWASQLAVMVGIGVGIDYALLVLTRYRAALTANASTDDAIAYSMATAGRSVVVAGGTVVVSMLGLLLMGLPYLVGAAFAASLTVLVVMLASMTLLPALLAYAGPRIDRLAIRLPRRRAAAAAASRHADTGTHEGSPGFARWSAAVQRRPWASAFVGLLLLVGLTLPITGVELGYPGQGNDPAGMSSRMAADLMTSGFGAGASTPLQVVARLDSPAAAGALTALGQRVARDPHVAGVSPVQRSVDGRWGLLAVQSKTAASSPGSARLLSSLRDDLIPASGTRAIVGGWTGQTVDQSNATANRLPLMFLGVAGLSGLLLLIAFRSWLVPLKAAALNLLSIFAAYGVVAAVAEGGWFGQLFGIDSNVPIPPFIPILMFAILFGLSMDYEVFLVGRIRELWGEHGDASRAVTEGLAATARVITAAAAIMVAVFGAFVLSDQIFLKLLGIGLASAILVDATVIRLFLVPAIMELLGERTWALPRWLDRLVPEADLERQIDLPATSGALQPATGS